MNTVLHPLLGVCVLWYLENVLIYSPTLEQHIIDLRNVLQLLNKNKLCIKLKKCELFKNSVAFLGHNLSSDDISVEDDKVRSIREWPLPKCVRVIQSFIGPCSYYIMFIKDLTAKDPEKCFDHHIVRSRNIKGYQPITNAINTTIIIAMCPDLGTAHFNCFVGSNEC